MPALEHGVYDVVNTAFAMTHGMGGCDNKQMVDPFPTIESRLDFVRAKTGCPVKLRFAKWIGAASSQTVNQWEQRDSLSRDGAKLIAKATGASLGWLLTGQGEPFPDGPIAYQGATPLAADVRLRMVEDQADALAVALAATLRVIAGNLPDVGRELATALAALQGTSGTQLQVLEGAAAAAAAGLESSGSAARPAGRPESSGKPRQRGR